MKSKILETITNNVLQVTLAFVPPFSSLNKFDQNIQENEERNKERGKEKIVYKILI